MSTQQNVGKDNDVPSNGGPVGESRTGPSSWFSRRFKNGRDLQIWNRQRRMNKLWHPGITSMFPELSDVVWRSVSSDLKRYGRLGRGHMLFFRTGGLVEILLSLSFPFVIAFLSDPTAPFSAYSNIIFSGISVAIALIAAIRTFYSWGDRWGLFAMQAHAFRILLREWELGMLSAARMATAAHDRACEDAAQCTAALLANIEYVTLQEKEVFFSSMKSPDEIVRAAKRATSP